jgi:hypothetical protein
MQQQPDDTNWLALLTAVIARARTDVSSPSPKIDECIKAEALQFLIWIESEGRELRADLATSHNRHTPRLRGR